VKENLVIFIYRWFLNTFALWFLISIFGKVGFSADAGTYFLAGFIFSIVNSILRPILTILSIPAILLSYGLFTLVVNGVILWISMKIAPNVSMSLWNSIVAGAVLSLINYAISNYIYKDLGKELE
jgi:putative membrane protein